MDRLRILLFTSGLSAGGAEHHLLELCRCLVRAGHEPSVCTISPREGGLEPLFIEADVPLYRIPLRHLHHLAGPRAVTGLRRVVAAARPDIVHAHLAHAEIVAAAASFFTRAPLVATRHSAGIEFGARLRAASRIAARRFAACVAVSEEAAAEAVATGFDRRSVVVLPNAVDTDRFRPIEGEARERLRAALEREIFPGGFPARPFLVGSAGGLKPVKNYPLLVRGVASLARRLGGVPASAPVALAIFGEGSGRRELERLVMELGAGGFVALPGERRDLERVYPLLDAFVLTSVSEGVPMALLEAMSCGVACASSEVGGIGPTLAGAGALVPAGSETDLVETLARMAADPAARRETGRRARVRVLERHNIEAWFDRMLAVYRGVLAARGPGPDPGVSARAPGAAK